MATLKPKIFTQPYLLKIKNCFKSKFSKLSQEGYKSLRTLFLYSLLLKLQFSDNKITLLEFKLY